MSKKNQEEAYLRLGSVLLAQERRIKIEITLVALLWLVGCPILCLFDPGSLYGTPDKAMCGLFTYSVSASMTGHYPKIWGSILAPLFAVLVVQRSSGGLCAHLKLGVLCRFSRLLQNREPLVKNDLKEERALALWKRIETIEYWGYVAGCFLTMLVILDSRDFLTLHCIFATIAFACLYQQNSSIGTLGLDFPELFPNWTNEHATVVFRWGMLHLTILYLGFIVFGHLNGFGRCNYIWDALYRVFGESNRTTIQWVGSVLFWSNEYAFAFLWIYVQMFEHFEMELWEFVGSESMLYMSIVSRFSTTRAIQRLVGYHVSEADVFLGMGDESLVASKDHKVE